MEPKKSFQIDPVDLAKTSLFQDLEPAGLADVAHAAFLQRVQDDEFYFLQGDPANRIYVLVEGRVKLGQVNSSGQQVLMRMIAPWTLFGGVAMAQAEVYPVSAQAVDRSVALSWSKKEIMALIGKYPQLALNAMQLMAQNVQEFQERFRELATERVDRRLARTLLRLASHAGKKVPEGVLDGSL